MTTYDEAFFDALADPARASAAVVVPLVFDWLTPASVLDVGCGSGEWLAAWKEAGTAEVLGVDGHYVNRAQLHLSDAEFREVDLTQELRLGGQYDLVMSLEVAEHLDAQFSETLVDSLVRHGSTILFSAATPGQTGTNHVNCQWPSWWAARFGERGYQVFDVVRPRIWTDDRVAPWYRQNLLILAKGKHVEHLQKLVRATDPPLDVAHPALLEGLLSSNSLRQHMLATWPLATAAARRRLTRRPPI